MCFERVGGGRSGGKIIVHMDISIRSATTLKYFKKYINTRFINDVSLAI